MPTLTDLALQSDEVITYETQFSPHMILSHIKTTMTVTDRRVVVRHPHVIFGFIEHGHLQKEVPLRHISQISAGNAVSGRNVLYGIGSFVLALLLFGSGIFGPIAVLVGVVLLGVGVVMFWTASSNGVFFRNTSGGVIAASGSRAELSAIRECAQKVGELIFV